MLPYHSPHNSFIWFHPSLRTPASGAIRPWAPCSLPDHRDFQLDRMKKSFVLCTYGMVGHAPSDRLGRPVRRRVPGWKARSSRPAYRQRPFAGHHLLRTVHHVHEDDTFANRTRRIAITRTSITKPNTSFRGVRKKQSNSTSISRPKMVLKKKQRITAHGASEIENEIGGKNAQLQSYDIDDGPKHAFRAKRSTFRIQV